MITTIDVHEWQTSKVT
ncbi:hypothetical protein LMF89_20330 [Pelosinus sp. Bkl1]|uniref:Uncharacterized protein n=1 Tax=Pelosinus baikalensis TaxID=2892015 RepID=A0ABS8HZZ5_9FIRM|nr:hypothetical protein [Pelosinus baikalensis]